jgi:hypothetical protein
MFITQCYVCNKTGKFVCLLWLCEKNCKQLTVIFENIRITSYKNVENDPRYDTNALKCQSVPVISVITQPVQLESERPRDFSLTRAHMQQSREL